MCSDLIARRLGSIPNSHAYLRGWLHATYHNHPADIHPCVTTKKTARVDRDIGALGMELGLRGVELSIRLRCKHRCLRDQAVLQLLQVRGVPLAKEHSSGRSRPTFRRFR